jgi:hypothetical protein
MDDVATPTDLPRGELFTPIHKIADRSRVNGAPGRRDAVHGDRGAAESSQMFQVIG